MESKIINSASIGKTLKSIPSVSKSMNSKLAKPIILTGHLQNGQVVLAVHQVQSARNKATATISNDRVGDT